MENCLNIADIDYKDVEQYKIDINNVIQYMISKNDRLVFAIVAERSGVNPFVIRKYPELRNYMLKKIMYYKEIYLINKKIYKALNNLLKSNKSITFMSIANKCKFSPDIIYKNQYIKNKIRSILVENMHKNFCKTCE